MYVDNGGAHASWTPDGGAGAIGLVDPSFGLYYDDGNWQVIAAVETYFPAEETDTAVATITVWRAPRNMAYGDFNGEPYNFPGWAELVTEVEVTDLSVLPSNNGNIPSKVYGPAPDMPYFDPDYLYMLQAGVSIYSAEDVLVSTALLEGSVYDPAGEAPDAQGNTTTIKTSVSVVPTTVESFYLGLTAIGAAYAQQGENVVIYSIGQWAGLLTEFTCDDFEAHIDGSPLQPISVQCS